MDEIITEDLDDEIDEEEQEEIVLATVTDVSANGLRIRLDGEEEAGEKYYKANAGQRYAVNDRVKVEKNSGTYIVEYVVGKPGARFPIPSGGSDGQVLTKDGATNYAVKWATVKGIPAGGTAGQVLAKSTADNYAVAWTDPHGIPTGGTDGQVLTKNGATNYSVKWADQARDIPTGGSDGQVLTKNGTTNYSVKWADAPHELPTGGTDGQVLIKNGTTNYSVKWGSVSASVSKLVNGYYELELSSGGVVTGKNSTYSISLGSSGIPINGCYLNGAIRIGVNQYQSTVGFFGTTPQSKKTVSTSGSDGGLSALITALKGYGLIG